MQLYLTRIAKKETYTIGRLFIDGKYFCDTIEDRDRGLNAALPLDRLKEMKVYGQTAIPTGVYKIDMDTVSPKFRSRSWAKPFDGKLPRLINVPAFDGVLIHVGNTAEDSLGCILVGRNKQVGKVLQSTATFGSLMEILLKASKAGESIYIQIV